MEALSAPFATLERRVLDDLVANRCVSVTGLSNSGKSILMRGLAEQEVENAYKESRGISGVFLYIDCNRAVDISAQAFYEVVLRSALERLVGNVSKELDEALHGHHLAITEAQGSFAASLSFNLALTELCEQLGSHLILLFDEYDEIYMALEERTLLNMRALKDRFTDQLAYVTATLRPLPRLRGRDIEGEFAELFSRSTYAMPPLDEMDAEAVLTSTLAPELSDEQRRLSIKLAGGHPGLLIAAAQVLSALPDSNEAETARTVGHEPQPAAESLKIWSQLSDREKENIISLAMDPESGLPSQRLEHLQKLGLVSDGIVFSPIFTQFVIRRTRSPEVGEIGVHLDVDSGDVWVDGVRIPVLTELEFRLLNLLFDRMDKLTDKYKIVTSVWGEDYIEEVDDARVEKLVSRLRSKIEPDPSNPRYLVTRRGRGYKLLSQPKTS